MHKFSVRFYHFETVNFWSFQSFNQVYLEKFRSQVSQFAHNFRGEFFERILPSSPRCQKNLAQIDKLDFIENSSKRLKNTYSDRILAL